MNLHKKKRYEYGHRYECMGNYGSTGGISVFPSMKVQIIFFVNIGQVTPPFDECSLKFFQIQTRSSVITRRTPKVQEEFLKKVEFRADAQGVTKSEEGAVPILWKG